MRLNRTTVARLARMDMRELVWRARAGTRVVRDRARGAMADPAWRRQDLLAALSPVPALAEARTALAGRDWAGANAALARHFQAAPQRFVIAPSLRDPLVARITREFPGSVRDASSRADRILGGEYDLLGYRGLRFGAPDWHFDPVHERRAPLRFWAEVPYLDPSCGDHKVIWELNRQQHWLALGRAWWLTGRADYRAIVIGQLESWLAANPPLTGINWASMLELALRSLSWIWALNFFVDDEAADEAPWIVDLLLGLDRQLHHVEQNLSYYFSPNTHLLGEALALYVAGRAVPELAASRRFETTGRRVLVAEIDRQIAGDGGHCERSAHYHRYTLDFYLLALTIARITNDPVASTFEPAVARLASAARVLADDRGRLPHLGDDDGGSLLPFAGRRVDDIADSLATASALVDRPELRIGPAPEESFWLLAHPDLTTALNVSRAMPLDDAPPSTALADTGYFVSRSPASDHIVIDAGPHGYQNGGHAHADALSLTASIAGAPLLIDPGTACYTVDPELRDRFRSTALHNTLVVDGRPQSVPSGPFHWSHTADAAARRWRTNGAFDYFEGEHDGYDPVLHRRHVFILHGELIVVCDLVSGSGSHTAAAHWHVDGAWRVDPVGRRARLLRPGGYAELVVPHGVLEVFRADVTSGLGWNAPLYGRIEPATTLRVTQHGTAPLWVVSVFGLNGDDPILDVENVPIWAEAGTLASSCGLRLLRGSGVDYMLVADPVAGPRATWRIADIETDACALFCRVRANRSVERVALVDGALVRAASLRLQLALPHPVAELHVDLGARADADDVVEARVSGAGFGARIAVGGRQRPIALERRAIPRSRQSSDQHTQMTK